MRPTAALVVAVVTAGALASCSGSNDDGRSLEVRGTTIVTSGAKRTVLRDGHHRVPANAVIQVTEGSAVLDLADDATAELRAGAGSMADSRLRVRGTPSLLEGEALVVNDDRVRIVAGDVNLALDGGAVRVRRTTSTTVGVYAGHARIDARGRRVDVPAFRQLTVAGTAAVPRRLVPLVYDQRTPDPWDRRFLGVAIDLGEQLDRQSLALTRQLARPAPDAAYLTSLLPDLRRQPGFRNELVEPSRAVGETLVGASITLESPVRDFGRGWSRVFSFRSAGARWGLVAVAERARRNALVAELESLLDRAPPRLAAPAGSTTTTAPPRRAGRPGPTTTTTAPSRTTLPTVPSVTVPPTTTPRVTVPTTTPPTTIPPTTVPSLPGQPGPSGPLPPVPPPAQPVITPVQNLIDDILKILGQ